MTASDFREILATAEVIHDRATLEAAIERMASEIAPEYANDAKPPLYITVMHGGLPFAASLAMELGTLGIDLEFDYLHATRYRGQTSGSGLAWLHRPATPMQGRRVLLADNRHGEARARMGAVPIATQDAGATSGAINVGDVA